MATATKPQTGKTDLEERLQQVSAELEAANRFLERIQAFSDIVGDAKHQLRKLKQQESEEAERLSELRDKIKELNRSIESASDGMIAFIEPGPLKFMPLFDQMEKPNAKKHGTNAGKWRELPLSELRLSPVSTQILYDAEILFIGQLQDKVLSDPAGWWEAIEGLTAPIAAAIADKLNDFARKGGDV